MSKSDGLSGPSDGGERSGPTSTPFGRNRRAAMAMCNPWTQDRGPGAVIAEALDHVRLLGQRVCRVLFDSGVHGRFLGRSLLALMLTIPCGMQVAGAQDVYQWRDEAGQLTFGDRPPADRPAHRIEARPGPSPQAREAARERAEAVQRLVDEMAAERRLREEAAAAAALPWVPKQSEPVIEAPPVVRSYLWSPYWPGYRRGVPYPGHSPSGKRPRPGYHRWPPPEDVSRRPRPPEFTQPWRAPEFTHRPRAPEFTQPGRR